MSDSIIFGDPNTYLLHYGKDKAHSSNQKGEGVTHVGSGRYEEGSGDNPYQHSFDLYYEVQKYKKEFPNMSNDDIYRALGYESTGEARAKYSYQREQVVAYNRARAIRMRNERQMSNSAIAKELGVTEGTVRNWVQDSTNVKNQEITNTANTLKELLKEYPYLDVGKGTAKRMGVSEEKLNAALQSLKDEDMLYILYRLVR